MQRTMNAVAMPATISPAHNAVDALGIIAFVTTIVGLVAAFGA